MIKIDAATLLQMLKRAMPFSTIDDLLPPLFGVRLYTFEGHLWAEATDRYVACGVKGPQMEGDFNATIALRDLKRVLYLLRWYTPATVELSTMPRRNEAGAIIEGKSATTILFSSPYNDLGDLNVELMTRDDFPPMRKIAGIEKGAAQPFAIGSPYMTRGLGLLAGLSPNGFFAPQGDKKGIFIGEDCWALIMPIHYGGMTGNIPESWNAYMEELTNGE